MPSKSDRIAISTDLFPEFLKQRLLFFDRIGLFDIELLKRVDRDLANDLEFLQDRNFILEAAEFVPNYRTHYSEAEAKDVLAVAKKRKEEKLPLVTKWDVGRQAEARSCMYHMRR
jgi:hypothetical protein